VETRKEGPLDPSTLFESEWSDVAGRLEKKLIASGVSRSLVEDVVQETGVRLFVRWARIDTTQPVFPLALTIARNLVVDHHRKHDRVELRDTPLGLDVAVDAEQRALARIHLSAVLRAMRKLNPRYQRLLLAEAGFAGTTSSGPASRTARSRARHGLNLLLERASDVAWAMTGPIVSLCRRSSVRLRQMLGRHDWAMVGQAAAGVVLFLASMAAPRAIANESRAPSASPQSVSSARGAGEAVGSEGIGNVYAAGSDAEASRSDDDGDPAGSSGLALPPWAHSKGHNTGGGHMGLGGFNEVGKGTGTVAGEKLEWTYRAEYRQPQCVRWALQGRPGTGCDTSPRAGAGASVKHRDREIGFETPD
jgi:hypothetical protein